MKIELSKNIDSITMIFVGEVDFFDKESPYIGLLKDLKTQDDLEETLENKGISEAGIKNIIKKLTDLKVLKNENIENIENGFPNKEYGKYALSYCKNNTPLPFETKNTDINREKEVSRNMADNIRTIGNELIDNILQDKIKKFKINSIENKKAYCKSPSKVELKINYEKEWTYRIENYSSKINDKDKIEFNQFFNDEWDYKEQSLSIEYKTLEEEYTQKMGEILRSFKLSYDDDIEIDRYGELKANFIDIPLVPKTIKDAKKWFIYLLQDKINKHDEYLSKEELKFFWGDIEYNYPKLAKFNLEFDFKEILRQFKKDSKQYWLLQAGIDLYPFDNSLSPKDSVTIKAKEKADLKIDFFDKFQIKDPKRLIISDRWVVNLAQYQGLAKIIETLGSPEVTVLTQKVRDKSNNNQIDEIIEKYGIKIIEKLKKDILHQRYWIFDDKHIYQTSESLDFIRIIEGQVDLKDATFYKQDKDEIYSKLLEMGIKQ